MVLTLTEQKIIRFCIVVPMYNEQAIAEKSIQTITAYAGKLRASADVLVINDGSQDNTSEILDGLMSSYTNGRLKIIHRRENQGYGAAIRTGIKFAVENNYDYALFMDSDLTNHPRYLQDFYDKMLEGYDYIKATRYSKGGGTAGVPWKRRIISRCGNIFAKAVTGLPLTDITNGFRAVKTDLLRQLELAENDFSIIIEELMRAGKITNSFCEIPYILSTRSEKTGPTAFPYTSAIFWKYTRYLFL